MSAQTSSRVRPAYETTIAYASRARRRQFWRPRCGPFRVRCWDGWEGDDPERTLWKLERRVHDTVPAVRNVFNAVGIKRENRAPSPKGKATFNTLTAVCVKSSLTAAGPVAPGSSDHPRRGRGTQQQDHGHQAQGRVVTGIESTSRPPSTSFAATWTSIPNRLEWGYSRKTLKDQPVKTCRSGMPETGGQFILYLSC